MRFYNPENFKQGQLILSRYYPKELAIVIGSIITSVILTILIGVLATTIGNPMLLGFLFLIAILPAGFALVLLNPKEGYHNAYFYFKLKRDGKRMQKKYMWEPTQYDDTEDFE